jgi:acyl phosphate:glycerol-3-phosphate acyltransferase
MNVIGTPWVDLAAILLAYLIGSVSFAVVVSRVMGLADPHSYGSGNPGATNVLRTGNRQAAALTLAGDVLKGVVAVVLARWLAPKVGLAPITVMLVGLAAFVGHLFPLYHRFAGGKGVATAAGVLVALNPIHGLATLATWLIIAFFFRYSSLAALVAAVFAPFYWVLLFGPSRAAMVILAMSALLVWRHRNNIGKLLAGKESRIGAKPAGSAAGLHGSGGAPDGQRSRKSGHQRIV